MSFGHHLSGLSQPPNQTNPRDFHGAAADAGGSFRRILPRAPREFKLENLKTTIGNYSLVGRSLSPSSFQISTEPKSIPNSAGIYRPPLAGDALRSVELKSVCVKCIMNLRRDTCRPPTGHNGARRTWLCVFREKIASSGELPFPSSFLPKTILAHGVRLKLSFLRVYYGRLGRKIGRKRAKCGERGRRREFPMLRTRCSYNGKQREKEGAVHFA